MFDMHGTFTRFMAYARVGDAGPELFGDGR